MIGGRVGWAYSRASRSVCWAFAEKFSCLHLPIVYRLSAGRLVVWQSGRPNDSLACAGLLGASVVAPKWQPPDVKHRVQTATPSNRCRPQKAVFWQAAKREEGKNKSQTGELHSTRIGIETACRGASSQLPRAQLQLRCHLAAPSSRQTRNYKPYIKIN